LKRGEVVVAFVGKLKAPGPEGAHDASSDLGDGEATPRVFNEWFQIGKHHLSPWMSWFHRVRPEKNITSLDVDLLPNSTRVYFTLESCEPYKRFKLDPNYDWHLVVYQVVFRESLLGSFLPNCLDVEKVSDRSGSYLFPLRAKKERSTRTTVASPAPLGMAALLARCHLDSSDDGGDDGADIELGFDVDDGVGSDVVPDAGDDSADSSDSSSSSSSSSSDSSSSSSSSSDSDDMSSVEDVIDIIGGFSDFLFRKICLPFQDRL
jgi:hypothetical protein